MPLPVQVSPIFNFEVPSLKRKFKFRPFLVREQKALLIAEQSEDDTVQLDTIKSVIAACVQEELNVDNLAVFDIEYIFLQLRAISVGELVELKYNCNRAHPVESDHLAVATKEINLFDVIVQENPEHSDTIKLPDSDWQLKMKYPTYDIIKEVKAVGDVEGVIISVASCIEYVCVGEEMYSCDDYTSAELIKFVEDLKPAQFEKTQEFFNTMPTIKLDIEVTCPVCEHTHEIRLARLSDFLA